MLPFGLLTLTLLARSAAAKPVSRTQLPKHSSSSTTGDTSPTCVATYIYTPSTDLDCDDIASTHGIQLYDEEANYPSTSAKCQKILRGYGICPDPSSTTTSTLVTATASIVLASNATVSNTTASSNSTLNATIPSNSSSISQSSSGVVTLTQLNSSTLTYTEGTGTATRRRTVVVTHTSLEVTTETLTVLAKAKRAVAEASSSAPPSTAGPGETPSAYPLNSAISSESTESSSTSLLFSADIVTTSPTATSSLSIANSGVDMAPVTASSCAAAVAAPAVTQANVVSGCTQWYVAVPGDYCQTVADRHGVAVDTFMSWNPAVIAPACSNMLAGSAYCVATCEGVPLVTSSSAAWTQTLTTSWSSAASGTPSMIQAASTSNTPVTASGSPSSMGTATSNSSAGSGVDVYKTYKGDGSEAAGWPSMSQWIDFDTMFTNYIPNMKSSCTQWGVPLDTDQEISDMKAAIQQVANESGIDRRFILAIIMQESTGCVRVITTQYSVFNPGLMQSHNGTGSCNGNNVATNIATSGPYVSNAQVLTPCPQSEIVQMIRDGTQGTSSGDGLQQLFAAQSAFPGVEQWYRTARAYNGGSVAADGRLEAGCCTNSYASDIANRLTGWVNAPSTFS